jgi:hypothetical protein
MWPRTRPPRLRKFPAIVVNVRFSIFPVRGGAARTADAGWIAPALFVVNKPIHRTGTGPRTAGTSTRTKFNPVREMRPRMVIDQVAFTAGQHLRVQQEIERCARELWCAGGCCSGTALNDWLQAEREVLEQFIGAFAERRALRHSSRPGCSARIARRKRAARILKRGRTIAAGIHNQPSH